MRTTALMLVLLLVLPFEASAEEKPKPKPKSDRSTVELRLSFDGAVTTIQATAGLTVMKDDAGKAKAEIFSVAYVRKPPAASRPGTSGGSTCHR